MLTVEQQLLYQAINDNKMQIVQILLRQPEIDINFEVSEFSKSRLIHVAVEKGDLELVNLLLARRPELDHFDVMGNTPLAIAASKGRRDIAEALLNAGANVNAEGTLDNALLPRITGITALHAAALKGDIPMMELLLSRGADIHAIKTQVKNPTASNEAGGRLFKSYNKAGRETALDLVHRQGFREAEVFLRERGAGNAPGQNSGCSIM